MVRCIDVFRVVFKSRKTDLNIQNNNKRKTNFTVMVVLLNIFTVEGIALVGKHFLSWMFFRASSHWRIKYISGILIFQQWLYFRTSSRWRTKITDSPGCISEHLHNGRCSIGGENFTALAVFPNIMSDWEITASRGCSLEHLHNGRWSITGKVLRPWLIPEYLHVARGNHWQSWLYFRTLMCKSMMSMEIHKRYETLTFLHFGGNEKTISRHSFFFLGIRARNGAAEIATSLHSVCRFWDCRSGR